MAEQVVSPQEGRKIKPLAFDGLGVLERRKQGGCASMRRGLLGVRLKLSIITSHIILRKSQGWLRVEHSQSERGMRVPLWARLAEESFLGPWRRELCQIPGGEGCEAQRGSEREGGVEKVKERGAVGTRERPLRSACIDAGA
eukprot:2419013-Pleurochrysis_carterae.AAC.2